VWLLDGHIFTGKFKCNKRTEGKDFRLQPDKTHTLFEVKYDEEGRVSSEQRISTGHNLV
jgi:hypothetical protein